MQQQINNQMIGIKRKPNSHTKLPKIQPESLEKQSKSLLKNYKNDSQKNIKILDTYNKNKQVKSQLNYHKNSMSLKLQPIKDLPNKKTQNIQQVLDVKLSQQPNHQLAGKHKIISTNKVQKSQTEMEKSNKQDLNIANKTVVSERTKSEGSSREATHIVVTHLSNTLSPHSQAKADIVPDKLHSQKKMGDALADWWCVVDSIFASLQKIVKVKKASSDQKPKKQSPNKNKKPESPKKSPSKKNNKKEVELKIGKVLSNIKSSIEFAHAYSCLEPELVHNQKFSMKPFDDPNHISLILQAYFYEKSCIFLLGSIKKWHHSDEKFIIHSLAMEFLPCIREIRKLIVDIIMEAVENDRQDTKIRKPKYIARQKKLIQISKFVNLMKEGYEKYMLHLGSPNRYQIFHLPDDGIKQHEQLIKMQIKWRNTIFDVPITPYISAPLNSGSIRINGHSIKKKQHLLVLEPLGVLYRYNKKEQTLHILPYAEQFLSDLSQVFHIVLFTHADQDSSLLNFLGCLENQNIEIPFIFDKVYMRYRRGKLIKDISKIGGGQQFIWDEIAGKYGNVLIIDDKMNGKYYYHLDNHQKQKMILIEGNYTQAKLGRVGGKLVKIQDDHYEDYLRNLSHKIMKCAVDGGDWSSISKEPKK